LKSETVSSNQMSSLLLVGDVRFDGLSGKPTEPEVAFSAARRNRGGEPLQWPELPGTQAEGEAIRRSFLQSFPGAKVNNLKRDEATESAVRRDAPGTTYAHFGTHGYFAPSELRSTTLAASGDQQVNTAFGSKDVTGFHPGLLSGLVLAGANHPVDFDDDDGILTALEVESLDLSGLKLATLSACETGLGKSAGSEGLLGLQRAFHAAGARTVVAGLWKVPDRATQLLMQRFYENMWNKQMSKLEALREAQLWMLRECKKEPDIARGLELENQTDEKSDHLPPYYWAAFVLSGDWR
jgi:CHAT domain-containing protein